jgi:hypothetical protein
MIPVLKQPTEVQTMNSDLSTLDLATLHAARNVVVAALRNHVCQWEQQSIDAAADGRLSNALMLEHWAFAAEFLATTASTEISALFAQVFDARFEVISRGKQDSVLDALALEVASAQEEPELVSAF